MKRIFDAVNIQFPISRLILKRGKTVETRTYPLPPNYVGRDLLLIETPGKSRNFSAQIVAIIKFGKSFQYKNKIQFYKDFPKHRVDESSPWAWDSSKPKWGWPILKIELLKKPKPAPKNKGIVFTKDIDF